MVMDVADEQDAGGSFLLRGQRLAPRGGGFGRDDAFERAVGIALAWLVIEHQHDLAIEPELVIVVIPLRRRDAETREHYLPGDTTAGAETLRIELLPAFELTRRADAARDRRDRKGVPLTERRRHQVVGVKVRIAARRLEAGPLEARADVVHRDAVFI